MNITDFEKWIYYRIFHDAKYNTNKQYLYCFKIVFGNQMTDAYNVKYNTNILEYLYPIYPFEKISTPQNIHLRRIKKLYKKFPFLKYIK